MEKTVFFFQRVEKKYLITAEQKAALLECIGQSLVPDSYGKSTVYSLYLDTPSWRLIRDSIHAGAYKEKLRLRSYGKPNPETLVFLEIKKKYKGVVSKRWRPRWWRRPGRKTEINQKDTGFSQCLFCRLLGVYWCIKGVYSNSKAPV